MKKFFLFILIILLGVAVAVQFVLPTFVESQIQNELNVLNPSSQTVSVDATPSAKLLFGEADRVYGTLENVKLGKLNFSSFHYDAKQIVVNPISLISGNQIDVLQMGPAYMEGVVVGDDLKSFLLENTTGLENSNVSIGSERIVLSGAVNIFGSLQGEGRLEGTLELRDNQLLFAPTRFTINGATISGLTSQLLKPISIYDFNNFPVPVKAESVSVGNNEIHIKIKPVLN